MSPLLLKRHLLTHELDRRSRYGFTVFLGACLISWISKYTVIVCLSTSEAEFVAVTEAAKDVIWVRGFLDELDLLPTSASSIYEDNQACVAMISNHSVSSRNKHFAVKMFWLREQVQNRARVHTIHLIALNTCMIYPCLSCVRIYTDDLHSTTISDPMGRRYQLIFLCLFV